MHGASIVFVLQVNWHTVFWSVALQFLLALFILRTEVGSGSVLWMTDRVDNLLKNSRKGSVFMFGKSYTDHNLIFGVGVQCACI